MVKKAIEADNDTEAANEAFAQQATGDEVKKEMIGHNRKVGLNPALQAIFKDTHIALENRRQLNRTIRDLRVRAKKEFGIEGACFNDELRLQQLDDDVRIRREMGLRDLQAMLGTGAQLAFDLAEESANQQPVDPEADPVEIGKNKKAKLKTV